MILLLLSSIIAAAAAVPSAVSRRSPVIDSTSVRCRFSAGSRHYDICPIFGDGATAGSLPAQAHGERMGLSYGDPGRLFRCAPGSRKCAIQSPSSSDKETVIASSVIEVVAEEADDSIILEISRGSADITRVQLVCDPQAELGQPERAGNSDSPEWFNWRTKYACPLSAAPPSTAGLHTLGADSDAPPPSDGTSEPPSEEPADDDLLGDRARNSRRSTAIIFFVISFVVVSLCIISFKYPDRVNALITPLFHRVHTAAHLPRISLPLSLSLPTSLKRAGERRLVRWAEEDLELDADTDVMVNGGDAFDELEADAGDEYIPLRPSPRKGGGGRWVKNYGSASPFW